MKKLLRILSKLQPDQFLELNKHLIHSQSDLHSSTAMLFEYLSPHYPDFTKTNFQDYSAIFYDGKLDSTEFRLRCSYLLKTVLQFLAKEYLDNNPFMKDRALIQSLMRIGEFREASRQLNRAHTHWEENAAIESHYYFAEVHWKELKLELNYSAGIQIDNNALGDYFHSLDKMHVGTQLKYLLPALAAHRISGSPFPIERWEYCKEKMEQWGEDAPVLARLFYHLIHLLKGETYKHIEKLNQLFELHGARLLESERLNIYGYLLNYLTDKILKGDTNALQSMFQLYQRMEKENLVFGRGAFTEHLVRNMVNVSCRLGKLDWTDDFLVQNRTRIIQSAGENVFFYISAFHKFYAGEYSQALQILQEVKLSAPNYRTGHQTLLLRIYYELNDYESVEAIAATFRRFLNRSTQLSDRQKDLNRNFISVVQLLSRAKEGDLTVYRRKRIEEFLNGNLGITDRTWLKEKYLEVCK